MQKKRIFTFWEPKSNMSPYIDLCMQTWKKFLPDYEIIICDYSNLSDYLNKKTINKILCKKMELAMQSDAIRAALINQNGGIWIDADTIITSADFFNDMDKSETVMIGRKSDGVIYGAFIYARNPKAKFINKWLSALPWRVFKYNILCRNKSLRKIFKSAWLKAQNWDYCVNAIIDPIYKSFPDNEFLMIDKDEIVALPEYVSSKNIEGISKDKLYQDFYFRPGDAKKEVLDKCRGIILLHNSWTPQEYKKISVDEFLRTDILIADLLRTLLK